MSDRNLLELIASQVGTLTLKVDGFEKRFDKLETEMADVKSKITSVEDKVISVENRLTSVEDKVISVENRLTSVEDKVTSVENRLTSVEDKVISVENRLTSVGNTVVRIENNQGEKLHVLFDGYKQHSEQLNRIEEKLGSHDEFILKRIK